MNITLHFRISQLESNAAGGQSNDCRECWRGIIVCAEWYNVEDMAKRGRSRRSSNSKNRGSWFKEWAHHYWPREALPIAYAMACVEVAAQRSERAGLIFREIIDAWGRPGLQEMRDQMMSGPAGEELREEFKRGIDGMEEDPHKPWAELVDTFKDGEGWEKLLAESETVGPCSPEEEGVVLDFVYMIDRVSEFIAVGFNREAEQARVMPFANGPWLVTAILFRTACEHFGLTIDVMHSKYKVVQSGGKTYDLDTIVNEQPTSPRHRRLVGKARFAARRHVHEGCSTLVSMQSRILWN